MAQERAVLNTAASISVVIAAYNEERHIGRLLASLYPYPQRLNEIIVVDDGSTDATAHIARATGATVVPTEHRGPAHARNIGAAKASGDVLVFLDGDMACAPAFLDQLVAPILEHGAIGTFTKEIYIGNRSSPWARAYALIRGLAYPRLLPDDFPDVWENYRAIRRDAFEAVGGYDDVGYGEDMTLATKLGVLAVSAHGAVCCHFNPDSILEIFTNGRWIGRGHDIGQVTTPWQDNGLRRALRMGLREAWQHRMPAAVPARVAYHVGVLSGLAHRRFWPRRHWK